MTAVRAAIDSIISDTSTRDAVINVRGGGGGPADPLLAQASAAAGKYSSQYARRGAALFQHLFNIDPQRAGSLAAAVNASAVLGGSPGPSAATIAGGAGTFAMSMTTGSPMGGSFVAPMAGSGFQAANPAWLAAAFANYGPASPAAGPSPTMTPGGSRWWSAVAALGQSPTPAGFWGGQPAPNTPPPLNPPAPPNAPPERRNWYAGMWAYTAGLAVANTASRSLAAYNEYNSEMGLAAGGIRGETDLRREYKAKIGLEDAISGSNPFSQLGAAAREWWTGDRKRGARQFQQADQVEDYIRVTNGAEREMKLIRDQGYVATGRGAYEQGVRAADVRMRVSAQAALDTKNALINVGAGSFAAGMFESVTSAAIWSQNQTERDDLLDAQSNSILGTQIETMALRWDARPGGRRIAGRLRIKNAYERRAGAEKDPRIAAAIRAEGDAAGDLYDTEQDRAVADSIAATQGSTAAIAYAIARNPLGAAVRGVENSVAARLRDPNLTDAQRQAYKDEGSNEIIMLRQNDADRRRVARMELEAQKTGLEYAIGGRAFTGQTMTMAGHAIAQATAIRQNNAADAGIANQVLENSILELKARQKQIYEGFEAREADPSLVAFEGARSGEDTGEKLDGIREAIRDLTAAITSGNASAQTAP